MEYLKNQLCAALPYFCNAGLQAPNLPVKPENKMPEHAAPNKIINKQKPWSVFEGVYWI